MMVVFLFAEKLDINLDTPDALDHAQYHKYI